MIRAVVDPGVLVSAFISPRGAPPDRIVRSWVAGEFELLVSPHLLAELGAVLARPTFHRHARLGRAEAFIAAIAAGATVLVDPADPPRVSGDRNDDYLVALAKAGRADVMVSGDRHLLELEAPEPPVMTPRAFVEHLARAAR